mgnify:CR=1 FL=1
MWAPCVFLWLFSIYDLYFLKISFDRDIPWNKWNISKAVIVIGLMLLTIADFAVGQAKLGSELYDVDVWGPVIKFISLVSY